MNTEPIIQSEVSQKEKDKYRIITHIYRMQKNVTEEFIYRAAVEKQTEQNYRHGERDEQVRCMERVTWKLTLAYVKQIFNRNFLYGSGNSKQGLCINLEGWNGVGDGTEVQKGKGYMYMYMIHVEV